jgi:hypothetical protein
MTAVTGGNVSAPIPADDPRMIAWKAYVETEDYANALKWATESQREILRVLAALKRGDCWCEMAVGNPMVSYHNEGCSVAASIFDDRSERRQRYVEGSLWAAFIEGYAAGCVVGVSAGVRSATELPGQSEQ